MLSQEQQHTDSQRKREGKNVRECLQALALACDVPEQKDQDVAELPSQERSIGKVPLCMINARDSHVHSMLRKTLSVAKPMHPITCSDRSTSADHRGSES